MQNRYEQYINRLPDAICDIVSNMDIDKRLRELAKDYKLHLDKWSALEKEIMLTLIGEKDSSKMPNNISGATGISIESAEKMTDDIAVKIFKPIREALQEKLENKKERAVATLTKKEEEPKETPQAYHSSNLKSSERKDIESDPYRESIN